MIDKRLKDVMDMVKSNIALPVIVEVRDMGPSAMQELKGKGLAVTKTSTFTKAVYGKANEVSIDMIAKLPFVTKVFYDEPVYSAAFPHGVQVEKVSVLSLADTLAHIGVQTLWQEGFTGKGVRVAVIDTGISQEHPAFHQAIKGVYSAVPNESVEDANSHGSWCASAVAGRPLTAPNGLEVGGAAPDADLIAMKALSDTGSGQMSWVMDCMEQAVEQFGAHILSMSLGGMVDNAGLDPISKLVNKLVTEHGVIAVVAVGNQFVNGSVGTPGGAAQALTVGASSMGVPVADVVSSFSSKGPTSGLLLKPDCAAPGGNILAPGVAEMIYGAAKDEGFAAMAGSSMATPQVAGAIALLKQARTTLSRADLERLLAFTYPHRPKDPFTGYGIVRVDQMYRNLDSKAPFFPFQDIAGRLQSGIYIPSAMKPRSDEERISMVRLPAYALAA